MELFQQAAAVCFVVGLAVFAAYTSRAGKSGRLALFRGIRAKTSRRLKLIERLPLTAQHSICVIEIDGREVLISVSPSGLAVLNAGSASLDRGSQ